MNCLKQILNGFLELIKFGIVHRYKFYLLKEI